MINRRKEAAQGFLYILPSLVLILVFSVVPILMSLYFSFTKYNVLQPPQWTGLDNYIRLFRDPYVRASLKNTVVFTVITVPLQTAGSLVLAAVIAELFHNKFGNFVKSSLFVPVIASAILVGTLWFTLLSPRGVVNSIIHAFGLPSVNWLGGKLTSMLSVCIVSVWKNVGYFLVIYFAGIMDIPRSLYEAAEVDGANAFQRFFKITLPGLSSVTFLVVTLGTIWSFQVFDLVYTMTGGGPGTSTVTLVLTTYNAAFKEYNMGYASAVAMLMFVFVLAVSGLQKLLLKGGEELMSRRAKKNAARAVLGAVLVAMALFALLPFVYMGLVSLTQKTVLDLRFDPAEFSFKNYARVFSNFNIGRNLLNSVIVTGGACVLNCIVCAMAAYGFAKKHFPGRDQLFMVYLATLMIPGQVTLIPVFTIIKNLGLMNTHIALMLPILNAFGVFLVRQFMVNVPDELIEAARIDGCGENRLFLSVVVPLVKPVLVSLTIFTFITCWNDFLWPLVTVTDERMQTLTLAIAALKGNYSTNYGLVMAGSTLAFLPPFLLYVALQKEFVEGIAPSGIKG